MDALSTVLRDVLDLSHETNERFRSELPLRRQLIARLFRYYREQDDPRHAEFYVDETGAIPLYWLAVGVRLLVRTQPWPRLPLISDLWRVARFAAGMHRERYHAGHYLPPPREWPPEGQRYAVPVGCFESLPASLAALPTGSGTELLPEHTEETP